MLVVRSEDVESRVTPPPHHRELKILLSPTLHPGADKGLSIGMVALGPGESGDCHTHHDAQETWFIISGRGKLVVGYEETELLPDSVVVAPEGVAHQIFSSADEPLKALFIFTPAGPELQYLPSE